MHSVQGYYAHVQGCYAQCTRLICTVYMDGMDSVQGWYAVYKVVMHYVQGWYVQCTLYKGGMHSVKGWYVQCTLYTVQDWYVPYSLHGWFLQWNVKV